MTIMKIYYVMVIWRSCCTLLIFRVAYLNLNNMFDKGSVKILHHFHMYEMIFIFPSICSNLPSSLPAALLSFSCFRYPRKWIVVSTFSWWYWSKGCCGVAWNLWYVVPSCRKSRLHGYQMILQQLDELGTIQATFNQLHWTITFYVTPKHQTLTHKLHRFRRESFRFAVGLIRMQHHPIVIAECDLISSICIPYFISLWLT